ncbi:MAG: UvrD-helicase domain-containing protein [Elusimicrobiota bacterium]
MIKTGGEQDLAAILADFERNIVVRACAGSGKTRLLAAKYLAAIFWQGTPKGVVAITFTEKAAQELKARVGHFLEAIATADSEKILENSGEMPWLELRSALETLKLIPRGSSAWTQIRGRAEELARAAVYPGLEIGTIHGFAKKLLERYPFEALGGILTHFDPSGRTLERVVEESCAPEAISLTQVFDGVSYSSAVKLFSEMLNLVKRGWAQGKADGHNSVSGAAISARGMPGEKNLPMEALEILPHTVGLVTHAIEQSREEGYLDYDLLLYWLDAFLKSAPLELWSELRAQAKYLLIDELQDTDPLQFRIVTRLAAGSAQGQPQAGRLFLVGDPFQSIYAFRGAAPELIFEPSALKNFTLWELTGNKRSHPGILDFINRVYEGDTQAYEPMTSALAGPDGPGRIWWHQMPLQELGAAERRRQEARHAAQTVAQLAAQHGWAWKDFAILLRKMTHGWHYYDELRKLGIPAVLGASPSVLLRLSAVVRELSWLAEMFRNPGDANALAYLSRSPLKSPQEDGPARLKAISESLKILKKELGAGAAPGPIVEKLVGAFDLESQALGVGLEEVQALDIAREMSWKAGDLAEYLETLRRRMKVIRDDEDDEGDEAAEAPWQSDSVKIATIHKVKGLEFPCVLLAGLGDWSLKSSSSRLLWNPATGQTALALAAAKGKFIGTDEALYESLKESSKKNQMAEEERILYVALTRAKRALVIFDPGDQIKNRAGSYVLPIRRLLGKAKGLAEELHCHACRAPSENTTEIEKRETQRDGTKNRKLDIEETMNENPSDFFPLTGPSSPALIYASEHAWATLEEDAGPLPHRDPIQSLGRILHGALERVPWRAAIQADERNRCLQDSIEQEAYLEGAPKPHAARQAREILGRFLDSPLWKELAAAKLLARELPVAYLEGESLVTGRVDLLYEDGGTLVICDYKTEAPAPEIYRSQGERYRAALAGFAKRAGYGKILFEIISLDRAQRRRL